MLRSAVLAAAVALVALPSAAHAFTAGEIVAALNAQRAANGIPAGIVERPDWSQRCVKHNDYEKQNGGVLTHEEDPAKPGYTEDGKWAGQNSVLASGSSWANGNPFEHAPIHLHQLLAARLAEQGADEHDGLVCATTWPGMTRPHPAGGVVYAYPGDGRTGVPPSEIVHESPFVPGDFVGLPEGTKTGPHVYVMVDGPWNDARTRIDSATLTGPEGAVDVRRVDNFTDQIGQYLPPGGILIPAKPLRGATTYTAAVSATAGGTQVGRTWSLTTGGNRAPTASLTVSTTTPVAGDPMTFTSTSGDADGTIASTVWDLDGDGTFDDGTGTSTVFTYAAAGTVPVSVRVTDDQGDTATSTGSVSVQPRPAMAALVPPAPAPLVRRVERTPVVTPCTRARADVKRWERLVSKARKALRRKGSRAVKRRRGRVLSKRRASLKAARGVVRRRC